MSPDVRGYTVIRYSRVYVFTALLISVQPARLYRSMYLRVSDKLPNDLLFRAHDTRPTRDVLPD